MKIKTSLRLELSLTHFHFLQTRMSLIEFQLVLELLERKQLTFYFSKVKPNHVHFNICTLEMNVLLNILF